MNNILCILFGHKLGEWEYVAEDSCQQVRECKRDGFQESRSIPHQFGDWIYTADKACQQVRICRRDGYKETRVLHQFGEWEYVADGSCEQIQSCTRDGHVATRIVHRFGAWRYVNDNNCDQIRVCERDGTKENRVEHTWVETTESEEVSERLGSANVDSRNFLEYTLTTTTSTCTRCGESHTIATSKSDVNEVGY